jgi:hypothetical protein
MSLSFKEQGRQKTVEIASHQASTLELLLFPVATARPPLQASVL